MARDRLIKVGIDYFSHDTDIMQDTKIRLLKAKHGLIGYAVFMRLLEELYRENGYYLQVDEDVALLFCDDNNISYNEYTAIVNDCIDRRLFDASLYDKYNILTSKRIQLNYVSATERRVEVKFIKEYLLVDIENCYKNKKVNVNILPLNVDIVKQSKVKESKVKESTTTSCSSNERVEADFNIFWNSYPKKVGKKNALQIWKKLKPNNELVKKIMDAVEVAKTSHDWTKDSGQYIKHPSTWLNSGGWDDEYISKGVTEDDFKNGGGW